MALTPWVQSELSSSRAQFVLARRVVRALMAVCGMVILKGVGFIIDCS